MNLSNIVADISLYKAFYSRCKHHLTQLLYQEMAALKCSHIAFLALLSLVVCSAHRTLHNEARTNHVRVVRSLEDITDTHHASNGHVLSNGGGGGGGGGGGVVSFPTPTSGCAPVVGSGGGYGSGSGHGNDGGGNSGGGGGGGGGGWGGGVPSFGVPGFATPVGGNSGGYGFGGGYGSGGDNGNNPPGYGGEPWGIVSPGNEPYHCQPVNCGNPYGCAGLTMYFSHQKHTNEPASNMPEPESTGHAMAPTESKLN